MGTLICETSFAKFENKIAKQKFALLMSNCDAVSAAQVTTPIEFHNLDVIKKFHIISTYVDDNFNLSTKRTIVIIN